MTHTKNGIPGAIDRSYQLLALLQVCEHNARYIGDLAPGHVARATGSLANILELAGELAGEVHDVMEKDEMQRRRIQVAS